MIKGARNELVQEKEATKDTGMISREGGKGEVYEKVCFKEEVAVNCVSTAEVTKIRIRKDLIWQCGSELTFKMLSFTA